MRVLVNAVAVRGGGARTYLTNILDALVRVSSSHQYDVVLSDRQTDLLAALPANVRGRVCRGVPRSPWLRIVWEQIALPRLAVRWQTDVLFAAFNTAPLLSRVPIVLAQHSINAYSDLPIRWPIAMRARHAGLRWLGRWSSHVAVRVVFVSETSARVMAPKLRLPAERVAVIPYGWRLLDAEDASGWTSERPYVLTVGDLLEHKNVETLIDAFARLVDRAGYVGDLLVAGDVQDVAIDYVSRLRTRAERYSCRERIRFVGHVPPAVLAGLYRRADLFVFPSLEETFGLPLVEAMGAGAPVVAADWRRHRDGDRGRANVAPEVCGEAAEYFDPLDVDALEAAMRCVLDDPARREGMRHAGRIRAAAYSWDRAAERLLAVFEESVAPTV